MIFAARRFRVLTACAVLAVSAVSGCSSTCFNKCDNGCEEPKRWSDEWYAEKSGLSPGIRQKHRHGKSWPPWTRECGEGQEFTHAYHHAHYWPYPYAQMDRAYVRNLSDQQVSGGWINATTLYEYHFDADTSDLTQPGELKLRWIIETAPVKHRLVFVQAGQDTEISQARWENVQATATRMVGEENLPPIMTRVTRPYGRPAREINQLQLLRLSSMPKPRIEYQAISADP